MDTSRRHFLKTLTVTGGALALAPALARAQEAAPAPAWVVVGKTADFPAGQTKVVTLPESAGSEPVAIAHASDGTFSALSAVCTHRGCTVDWVPEDKEFVCPCHRGKFDPQGKVLAGPPRRPLPVYMTRVNSDGTLSLQKSA